MSDIAFLKMKERVFFFFFKEIDIISTALPT